MVLPVVLGIVEDQGMSDTPRTDDAERTIEFGDEHLGDTEHVVDAAFARQLEIELNAMRRQRDVAREGWDNSSDYWGKVHDALGGMNNGSSMSILDQTLDVIRERNNLREAIRQIPNT